MTAKKKVHTSDNYQRLVVGNVEPDSWELRASVAREDFEVVESWDQSGRPSNVDVKWQIDNFLEFCGVGLGEEIKFQLLALFEEIVYVRDTKPVFKLIVPVEDL